MHLRGRGIRRTREAFVGERQQDRITIAAPADAVWDVIVDIDAYPQWAEGMQDAQVLTTDDEGRPLTARFRVDAKVAEVTYTLRYRYDGDDVHWQLEEGDMLSQLDGSYELTREDDGTTTVVYTLEVDVDLPLPSFLTKRAAKQIMDTGLKRLKARAEAA